MIKCRWCGVEVEKKDLTVLDLFMPHATEAGIPNFRITNNLCEDCTRACLKAIGTVEKEITKNSNL